VAALVYSYFIDQLNKKTIALEDITKYRYFDWAITTPMLLLVLLLFYNYIEKKPVYLPIYLQIVTANYVMLFCGYLGETKQISKLVGSLLGFLAFAVLIGLIYFHYIMKSRVLSKILFGCFTIVWTLYGVAYWLPVELKNLMYNTLDVIAKVFFGLFMWVYYSDIFTIS